MPITAHLSSVILHPETIQLAKLMLRLTGDESPAFLGRTFPQASRIALDLSIATGVRWYGASAHGNSRDGVGDEKLVCYDTRLSPEIIDGIRLSRLRLRNNSNFIFPAPVALDVS